MNPIIAIDDPVPYCSIRTRTLRLPGLYSYMLYLDPSEQFAAIIGASLSEPHINGTAMREFLYYVLCIIYYIWYVRHAKLYTQ